MRITGGELSGRRLKVPPKGVRPTQDRVRESLFNILADLVPGAHVLDLYAGSGAFGIEAWSRGADRVTWVERERRNFRVLVNNVRQLCEDSEEQCRCICADALQFLARTNECYDIVFADPPYDKQDQINRIDKVFKSLDKSKCLNPSGLLIYEMSSVESFDLPGHWRILRDKQWGETRVLIMAIS